MKALLFVILFISNSVFASESFEVTVTSGPWYFASQAEITSDLESLVKLQVNEQCQGVGYINYLNIQISTAHEGRIKVGDYGSPSGTATAIA